jgi:hypothetical protein
MCCRKKGCNAAPVTAAPPPCGHAVLWLLLVNTLVLSLQLLHFLVLPPALMLPSVATITACATLIALHCKTGQTTRCSVKERSLCGPHLPLPQQAADQVIMLTQPSATLPAKFDARVDA